MRVAAAAVAIVLGAALAAPTARAEPQRVRYGQKIATYDAVAAGMVGLGLFLVLHDPPRESVDGKQGVGALFVLGGGATYLIAAPVIHARRGNSSSAWTSVALRALVPAAGGLIGYQIDEERQVCDGVGYCGPDVFWPTLTIAGAAGAMALDWFVFADAEVRPSSAAPIVLPVRDGGMTFGLAGGF